MASQVGVVRNIYSLRDRRRPGHGQDIADSWTANIEGACGELAVAKHLGIYWEGSVNTFRNKPDVGIYDVRTNASRRFDDLCLHPTDGDDDIVISVLSFTPRYVLCGWLTGFEGKQSRWWRDGTPGRPAFFVPRGELHPLAELPAERRQRPAAA